MRYSNELEFLNADFSRLAIIDFATPGGPSKIILSPASAANIESDSSLSFS
jgi:hypothetical protein